MKKTILTTMIIAVAPLAQAAVLQTITGPDTASGGGIGNVIVDTSNDTGDWIDSLNAGGTVFIGFDWTITDNAGESGSGGMFGGMGVYDGTGERLLVGNGWSNLDYSAGASGTIESTGIDYVIGDTVRIVAELTIVNDGASNDTWKMWVNPSAGDEATPNAQRTDWTIDDFTQITHRVGNDPASATMENIVIADTFADAVPEPSSTAFLGLAGLALILRRRK
jgi:hypothetical protein